MSEDWEARLRAVPWVYRGMETHNPTTPPWPPSWRRPFREAITERGRNRFDDSGKPWRRHEMTWGEFKAKVAALGVVDDDELRWIDWDGSSDPRVFTHPVPGGTAAEQAVKRRDAGTAIV